MSGTNSRRTPVDWLGLIANLGVVVGLVLLAYELNQSNKLTETQAYLERIDQMQQTSADFSQSDYLPEIYSKIGGNKFHGDAIAEVESLSEIERSRLLSWERGVMQRMSGHYYRYLQGYLDRETGEKVLSDARTRLARWNALGIEIEPQEFRVAVEGQSDN